MSLHAPVRMRVTPSFNETGMIVDQEQRSGAFDLLAGGTVKTRLNLTDQRVYINRVGIKTKSTIAQDSQNDLPGPDIWLGQISTPVYLIQNRSIYNRHEAASASAYNVALPEMYRLGLWQSSFNVMRDLLLYGFQPEYGEGIVNAPNVVNTFLPADSNNTVEIVNQDAGHIAKFFLNVITQIKTRTKQNGNPGIFTILGPQRCMSVLENAAVVELTSYQRPGGGTQTVKGEIKNILEENGNTIVWQYDDTLEGKGENGSDLIIFTMRQFANDPANNLIDTNIFANNLTNQIRDCNIMYDDVAAPTIFITPLAGTAIHMQSEIKSTPGWAIRPEATTKVSVYFDSPPKNNNATYVPQDTSVSTSDTKDPPSKNSSDTKDPNASSGSSSNSTKK